MKSKRHHYEYQVDTTSGTAAAGVVRMVGMGKRVLEIGCGPGSITRILATQGQCSVTGLELDGEAIKRAAPFCAKIFQADLNSKDWPHLLDGLGGFDVVVAADVLEHLYDPWAALQRMVPFIGADGYMVISLPHIGHAAIMSCLMSGNFEYRDWGLLDRTHIRFFCLRNIEELVARANLKIIDVIYVTKPPEETEFAAVWSRLSPPVKNALRSVQHSDVYQVVVKAVPMERPDAGLSLMQDRPPGIAVGYLRTLKRRAGARMSPELKAQIRRVLGKTGIKL